MVSGCAMSDAKLRGTLEGAAVGAAIGAAVGGSVMATDVSDAWPAFPIGIGAGALLGGIIGYLLAHEEVAPTPPPPLPPPPPPPPPPQKIVLRGVHFDFDKAIIRDVDKPVLDEAAETLKANPNAKIYVNGYCDAIGSMRYNQRLSERRANAVAAYLEDKGIPSSQLVPQGFGKTHFVAPNDTAEGRAQNRRVELVPAE